MSVLADICLLDFFLGFFLGFCGFFCLFCFALVLFLVFGFFGGFFFFLSAVQTFHIKDREKHFHSRWVSKIPSFWLFICFQCCAVYLSALQSSLSANTSLFYRMFFQLYLGLISSGLSITLPALTVTWETVHGLIKSPASGLLGLCAV